LHDSSIVIESEALSLIWMEWNSIPNKIRKKLLPFQFPLWAIFDLSIPMKIFIDQYIIADYSCFERYSKFHKNKRLNILNGKCDSIKEYRYLDRKRKLKELLDAIS
jgi:hypothetical protein